MQYTFSTEIMKISVKIVGFQVLLTHVVHYSKPDDIETSDILKPHSQLSELWAKPKLFCTIIV